MNYPAHTHDVCIAEIDKIAADRFDWIKRCQKAESDLAQLKAHNQALRDALQQAIDYKNAFWRNPQALDLAISTLANTDQ